MTLLAEYIAYINADEGATLEAARYPWSLLSGSYTSEQVTDDGWVITQPSSSHALFYRSLVPEDGPFLNSSASYRPIQRSEDRIDVQWELEGRSGGTDPFMVYLSDGVRGVGVVIGSTLKITDISNGVTYLTISTSFNWTARHTYHLIKSGAASWELKVDGQRVALWPYVLSEEIFLVLGINPASIFFGGTTTAAATSVSVWNALEWSVNLPLAPEHKVQRFKTSLPSRLQREWNARYRALAKAWIGMSERATWAMQALKSEQTSGRLTVQEWTLSGQVLPSAEATPWAMTTSGSQSIVRQRLRMAENAGAAVAITATFTTSQTDGMEVMAEGWFVLRSYTADGSGNTGVAMTIDGDDNLAGAYLIETPGEPAGTSWCWALRPTSYGSDLMPVTPLVPIDPFVPHHVRLHALGQTLVLLVVNGRVVAREARSNFITVGAGMPVVVLTGSFGTGAGATVDVSDVRAVLRASSLARRPLFEQSVLEGLIHIGGCERNDELQIWKENAPTVVHARGTENAIITELRHLCCTERVYLIRSLIEAGWVLDYTWPDISPVFLDDAGYFDFVYVEFVWGCPNFTLDDLADLIVRYYVPFGLLEKRYHVCLIAVATGLVSPGSSVSVAVESSRGFEAGDAVILRTFTASAYEECVISSVPDSTHIVLTTVVGTYAYATATPPIIRKVLRTT